VKQKLTPQVAIKSNHTKFPFQWQPRRDEILTPFCTVPAWPEDGWPWMTSHTTIVVTFTSNLSRCEFRIIIVFFFADKWSSSNLKIYLYSLSVLNRLCQHWKWYRKQLAESSNVTKKCNRLETQARLTDYACIGLLCFAWIIVCISICQQRLGYKWWICYFHFLLNVFFLFQKVWLPYLNLMNALLCTLNEAVEDVVCAYQNKRKRFSQVWKIKHHNLSSMPTSYTKCS
jgi:hypothetical protein